MDDLSFILGLMKQNTDALGFIPGSTVADRYIAKGRYIIQSPSGVAVGYILHGKPVAGHILTIAQAVVEYERREQGHGMDAVNELIERARRANCRSIVLKCAEDLKANHFWLTAGFEKTSVLQKANRRNRAINVYVMDLWPGLF